MSSARPRLIVIDGETDWPEYFPEGEVARRAARLLGASPLALDILELEDGGHVVLESNETPGFSGFPRSVRESVAELLRRRLAGPIRPPAPLVHGHKESP